MQEIQLYRKFFIYSYDNTWDPKLEISVLLVQLYDWDPHENQTNPSGPVPILVLLCVSQIIW